VYNSKTIKKQAHKNMHLQKCLTFGVHIKWLAFSYFQTGGSDGSIFALTKAKPTPQAMT